MSLVRGSREVRSSALQIKGAFFEKIFEFQRPLINSFKTEGLFIDSFETDKPVVALLK